MTTLSFRASNREDAACIAELCGRVLAVPASSPVFSLEHMQWKYWDPWPSWPAGSRSYLLFRNGVPIAHAGIVPLRFNCADKDYRLVQLIDWAAEPTHVGTGVILLKLIAELADGALSVRGSSMAQRILAAIGFRSLGHSVQYAAVLDAKQHELRSELARAATLRIHDRRSFAPREHPLRHAQSCARRVVLQRSAAEIERWLACPTASVQQVEMFVHDRLIGSVVLCHCPGQVRIADAWADTQLAEAWHAVINLACLHATTNTAASEIVDQTNDPARAHALETNGFANVGSDPLFILTDPELVADGAFLNHQLIDSDLAYLHHGEPLPWLK